MDPIVRQALQAIEKRDWAALKPLLHPYLHWTEDGHTIRGRKNVLAHLESLSTVDAPIETELRDNQIYRWTVLPV
ncbi:nuclear transport factor 2 family protein [Actinocrispum sp. NPDC049592]|uniref:nuclear transport factor 2 family protein n=1 Tax=Actinocrispum sp. NPDC049592 TaxID=3154835 RepID=UPI00341E090A